MNRSGLALLCLVACTRAAPPPVVDAGPPPVERPRWPAGLMDDVVTVQLQRAEALAAVHLDEHGVWQMDQPFRGEADPEPIERLRFLLREPQLLEQAPNPTGAVEFRIDLKKTSGKQVQIVTWHAALGAPITVRVEGTGDFVVSPVELGPKLPDPTSFAAPSLWMAASASATRMSVRRTPAGAPFYELAGAGETWRVTKGNKRSKRELDDLVGVIVGRQVIGHSKQPLSELGLTNPAAFATLCLEDGGCREFRFGSAKEGSTTRYYAQALESDPVELRDNDWKLLVNGP